MVNGIPDFTLPVSTNAYRLRLLNGSNSRIYRLAWKDTVLLMPGERIRILVDFDDYPGMFLYHCHNLEHEDMGMMRNYYVRA
jgi:FtsP/CotA-like multicopper oxidase with cupredoxin domain